MPSLALRKIEILEGRGRECRDDALRALVIGGTGPTGPYVVQGLHDRGYDVTVLHSGRHEVETLPPESVVPHVHADPFDEQQLRDALAHRGFDLAVVMYGRLRMVAQELTGIASRVISIGGLPVYAGYIDETETFPRGLPIPAREEDPKAGPATAAKVRKIVETEERVFELHPNATHLRFPTLYGPRQLLPREWPIVKRALDRRPYLILPDGGLTAHSAGYVENAAHAVLLVVDDLERSAGKIYNVSDDHCYTLAQVVEVVEDELDHHFEIVNMPYEVAFPAWPLLIHHSTLHRVADCSRIRNELGYRDIVTQVEALRRTIRWQVDHLAPDSRRVDETMQDPYDYAAEDRLVALHRDFVCRCAEVEFATHPGFSFGYYGDRPNPGGDRLSYRRPQ